MKKNFLFLFYLVLILAFSSGCSDEKSLNTSSSISADESSSNILISSETSSVDTSFSSNETESSSTASSEITADTSVSTEATASKEEEPSSKPVSPSVSSSTTNPDFEPSNVNVRFVITDIDKAPIEGLKTSFTVNFIPYNDGSYLSSERRATTDKDGKTLVNLLKQELKHKLGGVELHWDKKFSATVSIPNGEVLTKTAEITDIGSYYVEFGGIEQASLELPIVDNTDLIFNVWIEEITE